MSQQSQSAFAALSLPKGGGAIQGIGETFKADLFSGTSSHSVPIAVSPGRNGFGPKPLLSYSSGNGNGVFGLGWQLTLPRITRKTEKGLPRYDDQDVFVMAGVEDLVPCLQRVVDPATGRATWVPVEPLTRGEFTVFRYRPRTEGGFARIERWVNSLSGVTHWRSISKDNVTSVFGNSAAGRLADPANQQHVYEWLLEESWDAFGNHCLYEYAADDPALYGAAGQLPEVYERQRHATQRYLRRICYGNLPEPLLDAQLRPITYADGTPVGLLRRTRRYAFEVVFDYGDWDAPTVLPHPLSLPISQELFGTDPATVVSGRVAPLRPDRFSHFRAGFEIRTLRRCRRVLMFHHFAELGAPALVRSTDFTYSIDPDTQLSLLAAVTVNGYDKDEDGNYRSANLPPVTFGYSQFRPQQQRYQSLTAIGGELPTLPLSDPNMTLVDLFGDGLPDILHTGPGGFRYWRNLGDGVFDRPRLLAQVPAGISLDQRGVGFGDMSGNGIADLLVNDGPLPGFFETTTDGTWKRFTPYPIVPGFAPRDPNVRMVDLTGDGCSDALLSTDQHFLWFACQGERGFAAPQSIARVHDLNEFPDVYFDDASARVRLADMTGDGLNDIVLLHDGRIDYWPNLGYGRFGKRITMANAPRLPLDFDPKRLFLADLNGTGCADLVYVDAQRVCFWFNQCGNTWSAQQVIVGTPRTTDTSAVEFADIFGTGTATLLWSCEQGSIGDGNYKALDFCGGIKPYVLTGMDNNMGAITLVRYAPSTKYFLEDQARGTPWIAPLPFPVQVVARVESIDRVSRSKHVTTYRYHHGHFDGREREFCGFGRVDTFDSTSFEDFSQPSARTDVAPFANSSPTYHQPPVETRAWFHTGIYFDTRSSDTLDYRDLTQRYHEEYYGQDAEAAPLPEHDVSAGDTPAEAYRALRGAQLRTEVYAHDGGDRAVHPYQVEERRYRIKLLQPRLTNRHAVYFSHALESQTCHYERNPADPRITHELTLQLDAFGNPLRTLSIGYGRRRADPTLPTQADRIQQTRTHITYTQHTYTNAIADPLQRPEHHLTPLPCETRSYELTGFAPLSGTRFSLADWEANDFARINGAPTIGYEEQASLLSPQKRLIEHVRTCYRKDDLSALLPLGTVEPLALPGETQQLAFTAALVGHVFGDRVNEATLLQCRYLRGEDRQTWWIPSQRVFYSPSTADSPAVELAFARQHFFATYRVRDVFGATALTLHDRYVLFVGENIDALGNRTLAEQNYRVLQPFRLTDPNGNRTEVAFDALGMVVGSAVMGKVGETQGDSLVDFTANLSTQQRDAFLAAPAAHTIALLGSASTRIVYDLHRYQRDGQPVFSATLARETHLSQPTEPLRVQLSVSHCDGFGREVQKKMLVDPGPLVAGGPTVTPRWVGSAWTLFNNKGNPVKQFEPFFDDTHAFRFDQRVGVGATLFYDAADRVIATLHPNHTWEKVRFDPWQQTIWDVNDTTLIADPRQDADVGGFFERLGAAEFLPTWHAQRQAGELGAAQREAALKTALHAATAATAHADALGRAFLSISRNRFERAEGVIDESYVGRVRFDIEGNEREISDANARIAMRYDYDMLGTRIHQNSMEAGERWMLNDVAGLPALAWNSRGQRLRTTHDILQRPLDILLQEGAGPERMVGRTVYGESAPNAQAANLRGKVFQQFDQAGVLSSESYDFKGNLLATRRRLAREYRTTLDWSTAPALEERAYLNLTGYDALNRPVLLTAPDGSSTRPRFNAAGLLQSVDVQVRGATQPTAFVTQIEYDAKGKRTSVVYGNGLRTQCSYDPLTLRLAQYRTLRGSERLQDLGYVYDPSGNVTHIQDDAQEALYFRNSVVTPSADYTYDALYRLCAAQGREHIGQVAQPQTTWNDVGRVKLAHPNDGLTLRRYTEQYSYDRVGNLARLEHRAPDGNWTRNFNYQEASLIEPGKASNRLSGVALASGSAETYRYDAHGNLLAMPHLASMGWDYRDQLQRVDLAGGGIAYYVYDSSGQRLRKVIEKNGGALIEERITLGGFEVFQQRNAAGITLERETLHVSDADERIALVETRTRGSEPEVPAQAIRYQFGNHLGSVALETDGAGQIISYEEYYPYGSTSYQAGRTLAEVSLKRYRYTGMERDSETGLSYHAARYYAPWLCRWVGCDPIGLAGGINLYCYASCSPVGHMDTSGLGPTEPQQPKQKPEATAEAAYRKKLEEKWSKPGPAKDITPDKHINANGVDAHLVVGEGPAAVNLIGDNKHSNAPTASGGSRSVSKKITSFDKAAEQNHRQLVRNIREARRAGSLDPSTAHHAIQGAKDGLVLSDIGISGYNTQVSPDMLARYQASVTHFDQFAEAVEHRQSVNIQKALGPTPKVPRKPRGGGGRGGKGGLVVAAVVAVSILLITGDAKAAANTLNPIPNITSESLADNPTSGGILHGTAKDVFYLTPFGAAYGAVDSVVFGAMGPRGGFQTDRQLTERALEEGRNPFCAQCHGPGGALDPNNSGNLRRSFEMRFGAAASKR